MRGVPVTVPAPAAGLSPSLGHFTLPDGGNVTGGLQWKTWQSYLERTWGQTLPMHSVFGYQTTTKDYLLSPSPPALWLSIQFFLQQPQTPEARHPRKTLAALPSSFAPHGCCCTKRARPHSIARPAPGIEHSGPHYSELQEKPSRFPRTTPSSSWTNSFFKTQNSLFVVCEEKMKLAWGFLIHKMVISLETGKQNREMEGC